jgi:hypothetical protein
LSDPVKIRIFFIEFDSNNTASIFIAIFYSDPFLSF